MRTSARAHPRRGSHAGEVGSGFFIGGMTAPFGELRPDHLSQLRGGGNRFADGQDDGGERSEAHGLGRRPGLLFRSYRPDCGRDCRDATDDGLRAEGGQVEALGRSIGDDGRDDGAEDTGDDGGIHGFGCGLAA